MLSKTNLKNQARKYYKRTLAGPGKFGVFILLCILIIFSFEALGLSNRENNLEYRTINKKVIPVKIQEKKSNDSQDLKRRSSTLDNKLKVFNEIDSERKIHLIEKILYKGALEQKHYENSVLLNKLNSIKDYFDNFDFESENINTNPELSKAIKDINDNNNDEYFRNFEYEGDLKKNDYRKLMFFDA